MIWLKFFVYFCNLNYISIVTIHDLQVHCSQGSAGMF